MDLDTTARVLVVLAAMVAGALGGGLAGWLRKSQIITVWVCGWALLTGLAMYVILMGV